VLIKTHLYLPAFSQGGKKSQRNQSQNGLPNDFVVKGKRFYELPNGEITTENPLLNDSTKE